METSWEELKERVYFEDGTLRDVYVFDVTRGDWADWAEFVNASYEVEFIDRESETTEPRIDFEAVKDYWTGRSALVKMASVKLGKVKVNCHFFTPDEFECDIAPEEFTALEDHERFIEYLKKLSELFDKKVLLSEEGAPEFGLLEATASSVELIDEREIETDE